MEGDLAQRCLNTARYGFNPRPRMEGDSCTTCPYYTRNRFNPRPRMEGDTRSKVMLIRLLKFQSTPPHGGRL